jgi:hypothetical protein
MKNYCYLHHNGFFIFEQRLSVFAFALSVILNLSLRSGFCPSATVECLSSVLFTRKGKNEIIDDFLTTYIWITRIFFL